jgi:hypothetical protein
MTARVIAYIVVGLFCAGVLLLLRSFIFRDRWRPNKKIDLRECAGLISNMDRNKTPTTGSNAERPLRSRLYAVPNFRHNFGQLY